MKRLILPSLLAISAAFNANAGYGYLVTECGYLMFPDENEYNSWWESQFWSWGEYMVIEGKKICPTVRSVNDVIFTEDLPDPDPPVVDDKRKTDPKKTVSETSENSCNK